MFDLRILKLLNADRGSHRLAPNVRIVLKTLTFFNFCVVLKLSQIISYLCIFSFGLQLVSCDSARELADVDGDRDLDVQQRPPQLHHVPPHQPNKD